MAESPLVIEPRGDVDLCWSDPGSEIDLYVTTDLRTMTSIWMGLGTMESESRSRGTRSWWARGLRREKAHQHVFGVPLPRRRVAAPGAGRLC